MKSIRDLGKTKAILSIAFVLFATDRAANRN